MVKFLLKSIILFIAIESNNLAFSSCNICSHFKNDCVSSSIRGKAILNFAYREEAWGDGRIDHTELPNLVSCFGSRFCEMDLGLGYELLRKLNSLGLINEFCKQLSEKYQIPDNLLQQWFADFKRVSQDSVVRKEWIKNFKTSVGCINIADFRLGLSFTEPSLTGSLHNKEIMNYLKANLFLSDFFWLWAIIDHPQLVRDPKFMDIYLAMASHRKDIPLEWIYGAECPFLDKMCMQFKWNEARSGKLSYIVNNSYESITRWAVFGAIEQYKCFLTWSLQYRHLRENKALTFFTKNINLTLPNKFSSDFSWLLYRYHDDLVLKILERYWTLVEPACYSNFIEKVTIKEWLGLSSQYIRNQELSSKVMNQIRIYCSDNSQKIKQVNAVILLTHNASDQDIPLLVSLALDIHIFNWREYNIRKHSGPLLGFCAVIALSSIESEESRAALKTLSTISGINEKVRAVVIDYLSGKRINKRQLR